MSLDVFGPANADGAVTARPTEDRVFGALDTWFKNCSSPTADDGTEYTAEFFNGLLDEIRRVARGNGATGAGSPVVAESNAGGMALAAIQHLIQRGRTNFAAASGTPDALTITLSPAPPELVTGLRVVVMTGSSANTTASPTLQVNGGTVYPLHGREGAALQPGDLPASTLATFAFTGSAWQMMEARPTGIVHYGVDTSGAANTLTVATWTPPVVNPGDGALYIVKVANTSTSSAPLLNGAEIARAVSAPLAVGDMIAGTMAILVQLGSHFELMNPQGAALHYGVDTSSTANILSVPNWFPYNPGFFDGQMLAVKIAVTNTGVSVLYPGGPSIVRPDGSPLVAGDLVAGHIALMVYHDGAAELLNPRAGDVVRFDFALSGTSPIVLDVTPYEEVEIAGWMAATPGQITPGQNTSVNIYASASFDLTRVAPAIFPVVSSYATPGQLGGNGGLNMAQFRLRFRRHPLILPGDYASVPTVSGPAYTALSINAFNGNWSTAVAIGLAGQTLWECDVFDMDAPTATGAPYAPPVMAMNSLIFSGVNPYDAQFHNSGVTLAGVVSVTAVRKRATSHYP